MAIKKQITFEGLTYNLDDRDRVAASTVLDNTNTFTGTYQAGIRRQTQLLTDGGEATSFTALTVANSGMISVVPELSGGLHDITLPSCAGALGCTYTFVMSDTCDVDFDVLGADSEKILGATADGAGNNAAVSQAYDSVGFDANAVIGSRFSVTCISATAGIAWIAHDILDGLAVNVGGINFK